MAAAASDRPLFDPVRLGTVSLDVMAVQGEGASGWRTRQQARLRALVVAARHGSPLWREWLPAGLGDGDAPIELGSLPVVDKPMLMARFDDWVCDPAIRLPALRAFLGDPTAVGGAFLGRYVVWESSGTSGAPGIFVQDAQAMAVHDALEGLRRHTMHPLRRLFDPLYLSERLAFVGATGGHFASVVSLERLRRLNPWMSAAFHSLSILRPVAELVAALNALSPTILASYPTAVALLAEQARSGALRIAPTEIWTGGETLTPAVRALAEQAFGCLVRNSYGASEFLSIGWECGAGQMHANTDWVILEPVDAQGRPVPPGVVSHSTLLTNLANHVQPLIRYDLGDSLCIAAEPCRCGSPLPVITVQGRHDDPLQLRDAAGHRATWLPLALSTLLEEEAGVFDFQILQRDARTLALRVGAAGAEAGPALSRCSRALRALAARDGLHGLHIVEEPGRGLVRGSSGKVQRVVATPAATD